MKVSHLSSCRNCNQISFKPTERLIMWRLLLHLRSYEGSKAQEKLDPDLWPQCVAELCVCSYFECLVELLVLFLQVSTLFLQLVVPPQQPSLLLLPHCSHTNMYQCTVSTLGQTWPLTACLTRLVCNVGLNEVLWPWHVLLIQDLDSENRSMLLDTHAKHRKPKTFEPVRTGRSYLLLALGAVPGASGWGFERWVEAGGVKSSRTIVALLQLAVLLTYGTVVIMLQVLLSEHEKHPSVPVSSTRVCIFSNSQQGEPPASWPLSSVNSIWYFCNKTCSSFWKWRPIRRARSRGQFRTGLPGIDTLLAYDLAVSVTVKRETGWWFKWRTLMHIWKQKTWNTGMTSWITWPTFQQKSSESSMWIEAEQRLVAG